jgi:hypothetical protein
MVALLLLTGQSTKPLAPTLKAPPGAAFFSDKRVVAVARAICIARGIDPDHVGPPFPEGPLWEFFVPDALLFLQEYDAAKER